MRPDIQRLIQSSLDAKKALLDDPTFLPLIEELVTVIANCFANGNSVWFCGNGGSAADAQHLAAEFSGRFYKNRKALPAEALHCNTSYLTAVANDYSFEIIYARLIEGIAKSGDILIAMSTSGNSPNIVAAVNMAKEKNVISIGFTGKSGGSLKNSCDYLLAAPSTDTPRIQECHMLVGHIICQLVESKLFPNE